MDVFALVDSGSEHNIFNIDIAQELDIALDKAEPVIFGGYGSKKLSGALIDVNLAIDLDGRTHRWRGSVIFSEAARDRAVLGQEGFFEFFDVEFRRRVREFEIRKPRKAQVEKF